MKFATGPASCNQNPLPTRVRAEFARIPGGFRARSLAGHLDVSTERQSADAIVGVAPLHAEKASAKSQRKYLDADAAQLGNREVAELVHQHHDAEHEKEGNGCGNGKGHSHYFGKTPANFGSIPGICDSATTRASPARTSRASSRA